MANRFYRAGVNPPNVKGVPLEAMVMVGIATVIAWWLLLMFVDDMSIKFLGMLICLFAAFLALLIIREANKNDMHAFRLALQRVRYTSWGRNKSHWGAQSLSPYEGRAEPVARGIAQAILKVFL